ncbi:palmitoyltransferase ZDHHC4-like [Montipora foliosa]|uniref:palmitoyltransferase ZDHHC4-like n=1 Tax=Montipora foliosa TaxID=591990 RepID=UPI0035F16D61
MDFLLMACIYTFCFVVISYVVIAGKYEYHRYGWIGLLHRYLFAVIVFTRSVFEKCIPAAITRGISNATNYVLFTRNPCIQLLYGFIITGGTAVFTFEVIPYFSSINAFIIVEYMLIFINLFLFFICSSREPGVITASLHSELMEEYAFDGLYYAAQECYTCKFMKPARSKHCSICNLCVSRFDHHCSWVNNCIGKKNYKFFLAFITSTAVLCLYTTFVLVVVFAYIVMSEGLATMKYVDDHGQHYFVGIRIITQYLLVRYPLLAILFLTVLLFGLATSGFSLFHCYLVLTNQTTNELYKRFFSTKNSTKVRRPSRKMTEKVNHASLQASQRRLGRRTVLSRALTDGAETWNISRRTSTPYYQGVWRNIVEVFR